MNESIKFEKSAFRWFMLQNVITTHGAKNILLTDGPSTQKQREFPFSQEINYKILRHKN